MPKKHTVAVMLILETDDPALDPEKISVSTPRATTALRQRVIANVPNISRVVAVMPEPAARLMMSMWDDVCAMAGPEYEPAHPPRSYVPPTRE